LRLKEALEWEEIFLFVHKNDIMGMVDKENPVERMETK